MIKKILLSLVIVVSLSACSELELGSHMAKQIPFPSDAESRVGDFKVGNPYKIKGRTYYPAEKYHHSETGIASWYGPGFHGKLTANGEVFNKNELTAAHRTLQMPSIVRVTNLENGKSIIVRVNDRGPFAHDRVIDLSERAARTLDMIQDGTAQVRIDVLENESRMVASAAKKGINTRGTELALNRGHKLKDMDYEIAKPTTKPIAVATKVIPEKNLFNQVIVEQASIPPTTISRKPVTRVVHNMQHFNTPTTVAMKPVSAPVIPQRIYLQTGAFSNEDNAMTMKMSLYNINEPINIFRSVESGIPLYRVKIGPVSSVEKADEILTMLNRQGREARMITN